MSVSKSQEPPLCAIFVLGFSITKCDFLSSHVCCKCATITLRKETKRLEIGPVIVEKTISNMFAVFGCRMPLITDKSTTRCSTSNLFFLNHFASTLAIKFDLFVSSNDFSAKRGQKYGNQTSRVLVKKIIFKLIQPLITGAWLKAQHVVRSTT